jgi:alkanesulfonate monooxygenase SsuD/methylene tetrahydromethanopterin reductase-like flavin-dependent oxidoreductase (luciferase family)
MIPPMKYALALPTGGECGDPRFLVELAERAEGAGWDGVFLEDYVWYQGDAAIPTCDVFAALIAIAVRTSRIRLATCVTPLSRRRPWNVARQAAAIDQFSDGRMILGVGLGDVNDPGFTHVGETIDERTRAERLDEALEIVAGLWSGKPFAFRGRHFRVEPEVTFAHVPVQRPRIPIWVGGGYPTRGPTERALRWDGSMMYRAGQTHDLPPEDVRSLRARAGDRSFEIAVGGGRRRDDWEAERAHIRELAEAGATWWMEWVPPTERDAMRDAVERGPLLL